MEDHPLFSQAQSDDDSSELFDDFFGSQPSQSKPLLFRNGSSGDDLDDPLSSFASEPPPPPPPIMNDDFYRPPPSESMILPSQPPPSPPAVSIESDSLAFALPPSDHSFSYHPSPSPFAPESTNARYSDIIVSNPSLVQNSGFFHTSSYWTYEINTGTLPNSPPVSVRRRFRNLVTLHDRLRSSLPGVILPPRPEKTETRAIEEGSLTQSATFARRRVRMIQTYLVELGKHPLVGGQDNSYLRTFLTHQGDLAQLWPEDSSYSLSSLAASAEKMILGSSGAVSSGATKILGEARDDNDPDSQLVEMMHAEQVRLDKINTAVPKLLAAVTLLSDHGACCGETGMELSKLVNDIETTDADMASVINKLSQPMIQSGRRSQALKTSLLDRDSLGIFLSQFCRAQNELAAFEDRRNAVSAMLTAQRASNDLKGRLELSRAEENSYGKAVNMASLVQEAQRMEGVTEGLAREAERVGQVLKSEILRLEKERRRYYNVCVIRVAKIMLHGVRDKGAIWGEALKKIEGEMKTSGKDGEEDVLLVEGRGQLV